MHCVPWAIYGIEFLQLIQSSGSQTYWAQDTQRYALKTRILKPHTLKFTIYILNHLPVDPGAMVFSPLLEKHPIKAIYKMLSFKGVSEISVPYFPLKGNFWS